MGLTQGVRIPASGNSHMTGISGEIRTEILW